MDFIHITLMDKFRVIARCPFSFTADNLQYLLLVYFLYHAIKLIKSYLTQKGFQKTVIYGATVSPKAVEQMHKRDCTLRDVSESQLHKLG